MLGPGTRPEPGDRVARIGIASGSSSWRSAWLPDHPFLAQWILPQLLALLAAALIYVQGLRAAPYSDVRIWALLAVAFVVLRVGAVRSDLAASTYVLDAMASAVFIGGTGDTGSPFLALALSGAWWASMKSRRGALYGLAFVVGYAVFVGPAALQSGNTAAVLYQCAFVAAIGVMADRLRERDRSRWAFTVLHHSAESGPESLRVGLSRAIQGGGVPIDVLLTAGQLGLTAMQTELIAYLILGLSNQEIADALSVSEATVRYRLTRLYRVLDVRGRKAAAERARELGLDALVGGSPRNGDTELAQTAPK